MRVAVQCEHSIRGRIVNDSVGIRCGRCLAEGLEGLEIKHHHRTVISGSGETMPPTFRQRGAVRTINTRHLTEKFSIILVDDHDAARPANKYSMVWRIRHHVVPSPVPTDVVS